MYQRPSLTRFGSLRELTQAGWAGADDGVSSLIDGNLSCSILGRSCS